MVRLTLEEAQMLARATKAPPGRAKANEILKECREKLQNRCGSYIDLEAVPLFHWQAYLAMHPSARAIFRSEVTGFLCEVFPEKEPNASKLLGLTLRVDFVCLRADNSAVRLHPSKGAEAKISEGSLESWRSGTTPIFALDSPSALEWRSKILVPDVPCGSDGMLVGALPLGPQLLSQPPPPPTPPPCTAPQRPLGDKMDDRGHHSGNESRDAPHLFEYSSKAKKGFNGSDYGPEYLSFEKGAWLSVCAEPPDQGWIRGRLEPDGCVGWFPKDYVERILEEAESVAAEDSASCLCVPVEEFSRTGSDDISHTGSDDELSMVSSGVQGARCFVEGTIIKTAEGTWVDIESLSQYAQVRGPKNQSVVYVKSVERIQFGPQELIEISAGGPRLITTSTHRYEIRRGSRTVAAPATSLRIGDHVLTCSRFGHEDWQEVTHIRPFIEDAVVFKIEFFPDAAVQTMCKDSILTRGHRRSKPHHRHHRSSPVGEIIAEGEHSIAITYNEEIWV